MSDIGDDMEENLLNGTDNAEMSRDAEPFDFGTSNLDFDLLEKQVLDEAKAKIKIKTCRKPIKSEIPAKSQTLPNKKKPFNLASLLKNDTIGPTSIKPVDTETMEGKRDLIAQKDREAKNEAKRNCIDQFSSMDTHLHHLMVRSIYLR